MTNKTPYELRFDLLNFAQNILNEKMFAERQRLENDWNARRELLMINAHNQENALDLKAEPFPTLPSIDPDELIQLARKFNEFISTGNEPKQYL